MSTSQSKGSGLWQASFGEVGATLKVLQDAGVTQEHLKLIRTDKNLARQIAQLILGKAEKKVVVDYSMTLRQMIATGHYDWTNSNINVDHFPIFGEGKVEVETFLVHLGKDASTEEVLEEMDRLGLRPAEIEVGLAFGAKYPDLQHQFPIIFLGSVWLHGNGLRRVPSLDVYGGKRKLELYFYVHVWRFNCRFLAVKKAA